MRSLGKAKGGNNLVTKEALPLREGQEEFVEEVTNWLGSGIAYLDTTIMGGGKTIQNLSLAKRSGVDVLVFCPINTVAMWKRQTSVMGNTLVEGEPFVPYSQVICKSSRSITTKHWIVKERVKRAGKVVNLYSPSDNFIDLVQNGNALIIFDEINLVLSYERQKLDAVRCLIKTLYESETRCRVALLSGTPFVSMDKADLVMEMLCIIKSPIVTFSKEDNMYIAGEGLHQLRDSLIEDGALIDPPEGIFDDIPLNGETSFRLFTEYVFPFYVFGVKAIGYRVEPSMVNLCVTIPPQWMATWKVELKNASTKIMKSDEGNVVSGFAAGLENLMLLKEIETIRLIRSILLTTEPGNVNGLPSYKVILFTNHVSTYNYALNKVEMSIQNVTRTLKGDDSLAIKKEVIERFQENSDDVRFIIAHPEVGGVGVCLDDKEGSRPRISFIMPSTYFFYVIQSIYRIVRSTTVSEAHVYMLWDEERGEKYLMRNIERKCEVLRQTVRYPEDINYPSDWEYLTPSEDPFLSRFAEYSLGIDDINLEEGDLKWISGGGTSSDTLFREIFCDVETVEDDDLTPPVDDDLTPPVDDDLT